MIFSSLCLMPLSEALALYESEGLAEPAVTETKATRRPHETGTLRVLRADRDRIIVSRFLDDTLNRLEKPKN
ncbi:MAG: hypothetical protein PHI27_03715 [Eubacteriales bacterium]|nr:hypothetical protein [Eubacteriales bacterium]MDD3881341.1 hypothetical protein [Eubacteriales bacterium]MDD4513668.1 hypothetical protein [Eubacteriales bacterium]